MKKILFITILISMTLMACAQTDFTDLPEITTPTGTDQFAIFRGGTGYRISRTTWNGPLNDSITRHGDSLRAYADQIAALEDASSDSSWTSASVDTLSSNGSLLTIRTDGNAVMQFGNSYTTTTSNFSPLTEFNLSLGTSSSYWINLYAEQWYVENSSTLIKKDASNNLSFTDAVTGTKTLAELAAGGGSSYTFGNGLTESGGAVRWGGDLTRASTIISADVGEELYINAYSNTVDYASFYAGSGYAYIGYYENSSGSVSTLSTSSSGMVVADYINEKGLVNYADYSANSTARSLIDKAEIEALIAAGGGGTSSDTVELGLVAPLLSDTSVFFVFGGYDFTTSVPSYGSKINTGSDTLWVVEVNSALFGTSPSLTPDIWWDTDPNSTGATHLWDTPPTQTSTTAFISNTSFTNRKIPPGARVFMTTPTVTTSPTYGEWSLIVTKISGDY